MSRAQRIGISCGVLLACVSGTTCWVGSQVWAYGRLTIQEPRFPILVSEVISLGLVAVLGLVCAIYFWRHKQENT